MLLAGLLLAPVSSAAAGASRTAPPFVAAAWPEAPRFSTRPAVTDTVPEPALVEVRLGRIAARTVSAFRVGDEALIPLGQFLDMAGIGARLSPAGRLEGALQPGNILLVVDAVRDSAMLGRRRLALDPSLVLVRDGELYLGTRALAQLLDLQISVAWPDLEVVVVDPSTLPIAQQLRRQAAHAALLRSRPSPQLEGRLPVDRKPWDGFVLDYSLLSPSSAPIAGSAYSVAAGADLLGGSLELAAVSQGRADAGDVRLDGSWLGVWRDNRWMTQLRLGDGPATGPRPRTVRGFSITNAPYVRPALIGALPFAGRLPPGWEIEAYRGGELLGYDSVSSTGDFAVELPVAYGENPVDFIAYGPYGERRIFNRTYRVEPGLLPARRFEYGLSGGGCRLFACSATGNLDLRYGLSSRWTAQAGAEQLWRGTTPDLFQPYLGVTGSLTNAWSVQAEGVRRGLVRGGVNFEPSLNLRAFAEYTHFDATAASPLVDPLARRSQLLFLGFFRPDPSRDLFYFDASAEHARTALGTTDRARLGASLQLSSVRLLPYVRMEHDVPAAGGGTARGFWGFNGFVLPSQRWSPLFRQLWARAALELRDAGHFSSGSFTVARSLTPGTRLEVGVTWSVGQRGPTYLLTLSSVLQSLRAYTSAAVPTAGAASLTQLVQGSVLYDRGSHALRLAPGPSLQRAGVAGHVFLDLNGNGVRDAEEPGLPHVRVQVGPSGALSDSSGAYRVWDIVPFEPVEVSVDSLSFDSPLWISGLRVVVVVPGPNRFTAVDVPILVGAVVEGRVVRGGGGGGGGAGVGGVPLLLVERRTHERRHLTTFGDGSFYMMGIPAGEYDLLVDPRALEALAVRAAPRMLSITPTGEGAPADLTIELTP